MPLAIDASVAFKWFVPEAGDELALALLDRSDELYAPDLIFAEVANAMWVRLRKIENGRDVVIEAQSRLRRILTRTFPAHELVTRAIDIGFELRHPLYDCIYLAMCEREGAKLITADDGLLDSIKGTQFEPLAEGLT